MENVKSLEDRLEQLNVEKNQLEEILTLLRREINKCQVERMQLISHQTLSSNNQVAPERTVEEIFLDLEKEVNQRPLQLSTEVVHIRDIEEDSD